MLIHELDQHPWAVCGFVAALQAAAANQPKLPADAARNQLLTAFRNTPAASGGSLQVLRAFFEHLALQNPNNLLTSEQKTLLDFGEALGYAVDKKLNQIQLHDVGQTSKNNNEMLAYRAQNPFYHANGTIAVALGLTAQPLQPQKKVGLALTAAALTQICKRLGFVHANFIGQQPPYPDVRQSGFLPNRIYGLRTPGTEPLSIRFGLEHWVYVDATGQPMTYGKHGAQARENLFGTQLSVQFHCRYVTHIINLGVPA